jgi:hypothetical protein
MISKAHIHLSIPKESIKKSLDSSRFSNSVPKSFIDQQKIKNQKTF